MTGPADESALSAPHETTAVELPRPRRRRVLVDQLAWAAWYTCAVSWLNLWEPAAARPALAVGIALGLAVVGVRPKALLLAPALCAATLGTALAAEGLGLSPILAAGAMAGLLSAWLRRDEDGVHALDLVNGTLATTAAAGIGAWLVDTAGLTGGVAGAALFGVVSAQGLWTSALRWRSTAAIPSMRQVRLQLEERYRQPVLRALELYGHFRRQNVDPDTLEGLGEVVGWVWRLALTIRTLDRELEAVDVDGLAERVELMLMEVEETADPFTRDRRLATATHLKQLLEHTDQIRLERQRTESMQEYALAYLEEARMGLLLARTLPAEATPTRLGEVLDKLRTHAREGDARRQTAREVGKLTE
ncbi:MAG: hypothetical protein H6739_04060 [Alphaproteobacteria bacterium]|nr:hypothetical protein [Alphaproteobacteria bacterium]